MQFLQELNEARAFRSLSQIDRLGAERAANALYLHILVLHLLSFEEPEVSASYAKQTLNYTDFDQVRAGNTDLYNLTAACMHASKYLDHKDYLIPEFNYKRYLRYISNKHKDKTYYRQFLLRLQDELHVNIPKVTQLRRAIVDWDITDNQSFIAKTLYRQLVNIAYNGDLFRPYMEFLRQKHWLGDFSDELA